MLRRESGSATNELGSGDFICLTVVSHVHDGAGGACVCTFVVIT